MLNYAIKLVLMSFLVFLWLSGFATLVAFGINPEAVGVWEAKKDIAYDTYMGEHYNDK